MIYIFTFLTSLFLAITSYAQYNCTNITNPKIGQPQILFEGLCNGPKGLIAKLQIKTIPNASIIIRKCTDKKNCNKCPIIGQYKASISGICTAYDLDITRDCKNNFWITVKDSTGNSSSVLYSKIQGDKNCLK
jgi:hypothetical protein